MRNLQLVIFAIFTATTFQGTDAFGQDIPSNILSAEAMNALAEQTLNADDPNAELQILRTTHWALNDWDIESPLQNHICWAANNPATTNPITGIPDMDYLCVSNQGQVYFPHQPEDFSAMLSNEDLEHWTQHEYVKAVEMSIHLSHFIYQDAGWVVLESAEDFLAIEFNMGTESIEERQLVGAQIQPATVVVDDDGTTIVTIYSWTVIGGEISRWTASFAETGFALEQEALGRFGGGGYD